MRKTLFLAAALAACVTSSWAMKPLLRDASDATEWEALLQYDLGGPLASHEDTVYLGGDGTGLGNVVRGGIWNWEADSGEPPEYFDPPFNTDPVGNQFRDGWTFEDRTTRNGPSQVGSGHWSAAGVYDFDVDGQAFAHRATTHTNTGGNDGPNPLAEPGVGGAWSVWIGTNLFLNPENCGWSGGGVVFPHGAGYSDGWSQGIQKSYAINDPAGTDYDIRFYHKYSVEAGFDTNRVEISFDGIFWNQVGSRIDPNGIFSGGDGGPGLPDGDGGVEVVDLVTWPGGSGTLYVRFRLSSDAFFSDNNEGGTFFWAWMLDNIQLLRNGAPFEPVATFETEYSGWEPRTFEGYDFALTGSIRPAGRITPLTSLACPPIPPCPETCGLEGNILMFADKDDCDLNDTFQESYATSKAFAIGGPSNPDPDGDEGRLVVFDWYLDGGSGFFESGPSICWVYYPFNANNCPYTPSAGQPGAGTTFNWSQTNFSTCDFFSQAPGAFCLNEGIDDISANLPADADSVILHIGAYTACRSDPQCNINDNGTPFWDNLRLGVFNPQGVAVSNTTIERYSDNFPTTNTGFPLTATARSDCGHSLSMSLGAEMPLRWVRSDTVTANATAVNSSVHLRFRVTPGDCQPNLNHPFFTAYAPNQWHSARMDTARTHVTGVNSPGTYMTCYHESDPRNGTHWTGVPPPVEPCDDILPDGLFTAGTRVDYFFEIRTPPGGALAGTFPATPRTGQPIGTTENFKDLWLEYTNLPELEPACDGEYANNLLVVSDYQTNAVPGRGTEQRRRLLTTLQALGLGFDVYDCAGTNFSATYNGIGRREDRAAQQPRPPMNGATDLMLGKYDCIWYTAGLSQLNTLSDRTTAASPPGLGGQPSDDQQTLETWVETCTAGSNRLLVLEGIGWASDIDARTLHGPQFLSRFGVDVLAVDYAQNLANNDLRRCARITRRLGNVGQPQFDDGEVLGSGCPDNLSINVFGAIANGEAVANFVESGEDGDDPINCADDMDRLAWHAVIRKANPAHLCERSLAMSFAFAELYDLNCTHECLFDDFVINGEGAELVIEMFNWAGKTTSPIGIGEPAGAPRLVNELYQAQPNPANPSARIRYTIAEKGRVVLRIFDVSGRLVRTLVEEEQEPAAKGFEVKWDGTNDAGQRVGSGVFFYEFRAPGYTASRKLVILK